MSSRPGRPGQSFEDEQTYSRLSGDGLVGEWQGKSFSAESVATIKIDAAGADGLTLRIPTMDVSIRAKFDKQEYLYEGPMLPPQYAATLVRVDDKTIRYDEKQAGKATLVRTFHVSGDGSTMTMTLTPAAPGSAPFAKLHYDRQ